MWLWVKDTQHTFKRLMSWLEKIMDVMYHNHFIPVTLYHDSNTHDQSVENTGVAFVKGANGRNESFNKCHNYRIRANPQLGSFMIVLLER